MALEKQKAYTDSEFEAFIRLPENSEKRFEFIDGEIIEAPSNPYSSEIAALIIYALLAFVRPRGLGHVTDESGGYVVAGQKLALDVAFMSMARQPQLVREGYNPIAPDLAVEVVSPSDKQPEIRRKLALYSLAGVLVWLVYPEQKRVEVYAPDQPVEIRRVGEALSGGNILPDFSLEERDIFPE